MDLFKKGKESTHEIPLNQISYNAEAIREKLKKKEQKKKRIKIAFAVAEGCLAVLAVFLIVFYWSSKKAPGIEWSRQLNRFVSRINICATVFLERINGNYSSIIKQVATNIGRNANTRIVAGSGQIQSRFSDKAFMITSVTTVLSLRISKNLNSGVGLKRINDVIKANLKTIVHGISQMYSNSVCNDRVLSNSWSELRHVLKENRDKLKSFIIKR